MCGVMLGMHQYFTTSMMKNFWRRFWLTCLKIQLIQQVLSCRNVSKQPSMMNWFYCHQHVMSLNNLRVVAYLMNHSLHFAQSSFCLWISTNFKISQNVVFLNEKTQNTHTLVFFKRTFEFFYGVGCFLCCTLCTVWCYVVLSFYQVAYINRRMLQNLSKDEVKAMFEQQHDAELILLENYPSNVTELVEFNETVDYTDFWHS